MTETPAPAGWFPDPGGTGGLRYWDGTSWTEHTSPPPSPAASPPYATQYPGAILPSTVAPRRGMSVGLIVAIVAVVGLAVVFIIAILLAIAIPTFLGASERANDRAAQSSARNALAAAKVIYIDARTYATLTPELLSSIEPSLTYTYDSSSGFRDVSIAPAEGSITIAVRSKSGTCWLVRDEPLVGTSYGSAPEGLPCTATLVETAMSPGGWD